MASTTRTRLCLLLVVVHRPLHLAALTATEGTLNCYALLHEAAVVFGLFTSFAQRKTNARTKRARYAKLETHLPFQSVENKLSFGTARSNFSLAPANKC